MDEMTAKGLLVATKLQRLFIEVFFSVLQLIVLVFWLTAFTVLIQSHRSH